MFYFYILKNMTQAIQVGLLYNVLYFLWMSFKIYEHTIYKYIALPF